MLPMGGVLLRRVLFGLVALFVGLSASFFFFASKYPPLHSTPLIHAYWVWLRGLATGRSLSQGLLSGHLLSSVGGAFGRTLLLLLVSLTLVLVISLPLGCLAAAKRGSALDFILRCASYAVWAVPAFLLATIAQEGLGRIPGGWGLGWFPYVGWAGECPNGQGIDEHNFQCPSGGTGLNHVGLVFDHLALPAFALALGLIGLQARYLRSSLIDTLDAPFIMVARAKGLTEMAVVLRHGVRNSLVTFVPALVSDFGVVFGAALAVDFIFQLGGIGTLFINDLKLNADGFVPVDTYALQLALLLGGGLMITASILGEVALWILDPRARPN
jgi:ABC-type dipeptide/oligopeptide/nickel transport system permease component